jgi:hypothetical protein
MVGVLAALGGFGLSDETYRHALATNFAGKEAVIRENQAVFALGQAMGRTADGLGRPRRNARLSCVFGGERREFRPDFETKGWTGMDEQNPTM